MILNKGVKMPVLPPAIKPSAAASNTLWTFDDPWEGGMEGAQGGKEVGREEEKECGTVKLGRGT